MPNTPSHPNILFFFTDDQRFDTIRALGNGEIITPTMDALAEGGTAFTNAYIMGGNSPAVCMPSRAMLMSGRTLFRLDRQGQEVPADHALMGECFHRAGYQTFGTGKWHNGKSAYTRSFTDGAEIFFGGMDDHWNVPVYHFDLSGQYSATRPIIKNPWFTKTVEQRQCDHVVAGKHSSELFCDAAIDFLHRREADKPFFMYVSFMAPHDPRSMPPEYLAMYDPERITLPPNFMGAHPFDNGELKVRDEQLEDWPRTPEAIRRHIADYYAMITHADAQMARVLEVLRETGEADNTIIVFAGDNGLAVGRHGLMGKQSLYEHSVHVPLLFAGPGIPRGERREAFAYLLDIFPTLCELTGQPIPPTVEGHSLLPALRDPREPVRDTLYFAYTGVQRGVRDARFKLIEYVVNGRRTTQLFDLQDDPWELRNLAGDPACSKELRRLRSELLRWRDALDDTSEQAQAFWQGFG